MKNEAGWASSVFVVKKYLRWTSTDWIPYLFWLFFLFGLLSHPQFREPGACRFFEARSNELISIVIWPIWAIWPCLFVTDQRKYWEDQNINSCFPYFVCFLLLLLSSFLCCTCLSACLPSCLPHVLFLLSSSLPRIFFFVSSFPRFNISSSTVPCSRQICLLLVSSSLSISSLLHFPRSFLSAFLGVDLFLQGNW